MSVDSDRAGRLRMRTGKMIKRSEMLAALGACATLAVAGCGGKAGDTIAVGSKDFTESMLLGEMYAQLLENNGFSVRRRLGLGTTEVATAALRKGSIDVYPEYTGTGLLVVLHEPIIRDDRAAFAKVAHDYQQQLNLTWLTPAPMNNTQALAVTKAVAERYSLRTVSDLARTAERLRLGAIPEFMQRADGFPALQKTYGAFKFKDVKLLDIGVKYRALAAGDVDVVVAFGTDGRIAADQLEVLIDDKHAWPGYHVAPVVRTAALQAMPKIRPVLDALASHLTDASMRRVNEEVDGKKRDIGDVAAEFLHAAKLLRAA